MGVLVPPAGSWSFSSSPVVSLGVVVYQAVLDAFATWLWTDWQQWLPLVVGGYTSAWMFGRVVRLLGGGPRGGTR